MAIACRARLLVVCAMLSLPLVAPAFAVDPEIKPPIIGLVSTGSSDNTLTPLTQKAGIFGGVVVQATWSQLQATNSPNVDIKPIESALDQVRHYNSQNPNRSLAVRLRVFSGCRAPDWAKTLGGVGPFSNVADCPGGFGPFWSSAYRQAWTFLVQHLAAKRSEEHTS